MYIAHRNILEYWLIFTFTYSIKKKIYKINIKSSSSVAQDQEED